MKFSVMALASLALATGRADGDVSDPVNVYTRPDETVLWRTATNHSFTVRWAFPEGAQSADLTVCGMKGVQSFSGLTDTSLDLDLPEAADPRTEDVYWLTLAFDNGVTNVAQVGVLRGIGADEAATRCLVDDKGRAWKKVRESAVLGVPSGTMRFRINGDEVETGLAGAAGWYGLKATAKETVTVTLEGEDDPVSRELLLCPYGGLMLYVR